MTEQQWAALTPVDQLTALCEALGYERRPDGKRWRSSNRRAWYTWRWFNPRSGQYHYSSELPNLLFSMDLLRPHELHAVWPQRYGPWRQLLESIVVRNGGQGGVLFANAEERAEALARLLLTEAKSG
jgi:hypothetical protein